MTPEQLRALADEIAADHERRLQAFLELHDAYLAHWQALPPDLQERFINEFGCEFGIGDSCVPRPLETGAGDGMADGTGHTGDGSLDEAARAAVRAADRRNYEALLRSVGSTPQEAPRIEAISNGNGSAARIGDDCPEFLRRKAVAA
jgi:hypothetical protein